MGEPAHGANLPVESRGGVRKAHSSSYLSPSRWHFSSGVEPYTLRTTLLIFADDMAAVTATTRQPLPTTPETTRATKVLQAVTNYLVGNQLPVHNVKSATMVHNAPPPPLCPEDPLINPVSTAIYLVIQQAATASGSPYHQT